MIHPDVEELRDIGARLCSAVEQALKALLDVAPGPGAAAAVETACSGFIAAVGPLQQRLAQLVESAPDGPIAVDAGGVQMVIANVMDEFVAGDQLDACRIALINARAALFRLQQSG
jgi:hypothetical protein